LQKLTRSTAKASDPRKGLLPGERPAHEALEKRLGAAAEQLRANSSLRSKEHSAPVLDLIEVFEPRMPLNCRGRQGAAPHMDDNYLPMREDFVRLKAERDAHLDALTQRRSKAKPRGGATLCYSASNFGKSRVKR